MLLTPYTVWIHIIKFIFSGWPFRSNYSARAYFLHNGTSFVGNVSRIGSRHEQKKPIQPILIFTKHATGSSLFFSFSTCLLNFNLCLTKGIYTGTFDVFPIRTNCLANQVSSIDVRQAKPKVILCSVVVSMSPWRLGFDSQQEDFLSFRQPVKLGR